MFLVSRLLFSSSHLFFHLLAPSPLPLIIPTYSLIFSSFILSFCSSFPLSPLVPHSSIFFSPSLSLLISFFPASSSSHSLFYISFPVVYSHPSVMSFLNFLSPSSSFSLLSFLSLNFCPPFPFTFHLTFLTPHPLLSFLLLLVLLCQTQLPGVDIQTWPLSKRRGSPSL